MNKYELHKTSNPLRDVILGGQDGLVNALGIILGVLAATNEIHILIATVIAATLAESISMGAVAYTSALAQRDFYKSERRREEDEVERVPEAERQEIRDIYARKGFGGKVLEEIVDTITKDKKIWVDIMMDEELHLAPVDTKAVLVSSVIVTIATAIGHLIPVMPFFFAGRETALVISVVISGLTLFAVGAYQAITLVGRWWENGMRMLIIGLGAAFIGYFIARLFGAVT